jgi:GH24 family phage-related lysozyme (muramidase)
MTPREQNDMVIEAMLEARAARSGPKMSPAGVDHLKLYEELRLKPYDDRTGKEVRSAKECKGKPTIGWGHVILPDEEHLFKGITERKAEEIFRKDLAPRERQVAALVKVPLTQGQFDALVSFEFNTGRLATSTLLRRLNQGQYAAVPQQLMLWVNDDGKRVEGLVNRRKKEVRMWRGEGYATA